jgi:hypothetical protein
MPTTTCQYSRRKSWSSKIGREENGAWRCTEKRSKQMEPLCNRHWILVSTGRHKVEFFFVIFLQVTKLLCMIICCSLWLQETGKKLNSYLQIFMAHYFPIFNLHTCIKMQDTFSNTQHGKLDSSKIDMSTWTHNQMLDLRIFLVQKCLAVKEGNRKSSNPWHWHDQHRIWERIKQF